MVKKVYQQLPKKHKSLIIGLSLLMLIILLLPSEQATASKATKGDILETGTRYALQLPEIVEHQPEEQLVTAEDRWKTFEVRNGDTLARIFKRAGLSSRDVYEVTHSDKKAKQLTQIKPGEKLNLNLDENGKLQKLSYQFSRLSSLEITATDKGYTSEIFEKEPELRVKSTSGLIRSSFWNAGMDAGLSPVQIMNLANIFGWDIDFALEIREGDSFSIIYEDKYIDGERIAEGDILAAEFINQGEAFYAIRHSDGKYYSEEGRSMRKSFLRAPVNFKYISSNFKPKRFHPILKRWKSHNGVDYVAPKGTPVLASGDGKVIAATYNKYNGNYVFIQHGEKYVTKYLHFTKRAVKNGQKVKQGQVIGYVGATGLAEAPHLHYEFLVDGTHRNPRTVKLPKAQPIDKNQRSAFMQIAGQRLDQLKHNRKVMLAMHNGRANDFSD